MKTVRIYPVAPGRVDGKNGASGPWADAANALAPGGGHAVVSLATGRFSNFTFETKIPVFAAIKSARLLARVAVDTANGSQFWLQAPWYGGWADSLCWLNESGEMVSAGNVGVSRLDFPVNAGFSDAIAPLQPSVISILNNEKRARLLFSVMFYGHLMPGWEESDVARVDYVAIEFDYTIPPMPWKGSVHIQGDPMTTQKIKQGANAPNISVSVTDATGAPLDLRGCKLSLVARSSSHEFGGEVTITDAEQGKGFYAWQENDTSVPGLYRVELVAEWLDGSRVIIPFDRYGLIEVVPSL